MVHGAMIGYAINAVSCPAAGVWDKQSFTTVSGKLQGGEESLCHSSLQA